MQFDILTIFPEIINSYISESILKRGQKAGAIKIKTHNFRNFSTDKHHSVDDSPYGGGPGMVLKVEPIYRCLESLGLVKDGRKVKQPKTKVIILDPAGHKFDQKMARQFAKLERLVMICGRYEGFDERVYKFADAKISIGDYVLSGGELAALTVLEATARLVPGVLGNPESLKTETFSKIPNSKFQILNSSFKEYPQYTRPAELQGLKVPKILLSGNHKKITAWREKKSKEK